MYQLQSPQTPLVRTRRYEQYRMDEFPSGTNMVVAVLSYTGARGAALRARTLPSMGAPPASCCRNCRAPVPSQGHA